MTKHTVKEDSSIRIEIFMREVLSMERNMVRESMFFLMGMFIKESGSMMKKMD